MGGVDGAGGSSKYSVLFELVFGTKILHKLWNAEISDFELVERAVTRRSLACERNPPSLVCCTVSPKPTNRIEVAPTDISSDFPRE